MYVSKTLLLAVGAAVKHNSVLLPLLLFPPPLPSLSACRCPALHVACCPRLPLFSCRCPHHRCCHSPLLLNQSSSPKAVITISPLVPPSFVDCCFKRRAKPLLPTMVPSLSSGLPSLVGCFRCPPPPTLAASHGRRHTSSPVRYPHSRRFNVTVIIARSSHCRCDAAGGGTTRDRCHCCRPRRCRWGHHCRWGSRQRSFAHHPCPRRASDSPPSPQSRASTAPIARRSPPPPHNDDARDHACPKSGCNDLCVLHEHTFSLMSDWIGTLSSNLQEMVCLQILD